MRRRLVAELAKAFPHAQISMRIWDGAYHVKLEFKHSYCVFTPDVEMMEKPYDQVTMETIIDLITNLPFSVSATYDEDEDEDGGGHGV